MHVRNVSPEPRVMQEAVQGDIHIMGGSGLRFAGCFVHTARSTRKLIGSAALEQGSYFMGDKMLVRCPVM